MNDVSQLKSVFIETDLGAGASQVYDRWTFFGLEAWILVWVVELLLIEVG